MPHTEPSLHLLVVSDLVPGRDAGKPALVDKDSLDAFLREVAPTAEVAAGGARASLVFHDFKDFRPERIAARLPAAADLLAARAAALALAGGSGSVDAVRAALAKLGAYPVLADALRAALAPPGPRPPEPAPAAPAPPPPSGGIFDLVDVDGPAPDPSSLRSERAAAQLIDAVLGVGGESGPPAAAVRAAASKADQALAPLLRSVLRDPRFRALEASWRGLRHLVRSLDFRAGARLHVLAAPKQADPLDVFNRVLPLAEELQAQGRTPVLVLDFDYAGDDKGLQTVSLNAASAGIPVIAATGLETAAMDLAARLGESTPSSWTRFRGEPAAGWLALVVNRVLLRAPYGKELDRVRDFDFEENADGATDYLWGRGATVLAALVAGSFARHGWGADFAGQKAAESLEPFPLRPGENADSPVETDLSEKAAIALEDAGLLPLAGRRNSDRPFAAGAATVGTGATLRRALFAAQVQAGVTSILPKLDPTATPDEWARTLAGALQILGTAAGGVSLYRVDARPDSEVPPAVIVRVVPSGGVLRGLPELSFKVPLPR